MHLIEKFLGKQGTPTGGGLPMPAKEFLAWAGAKEIILDDRYSSDQQQRD
jgi:hypothetical protein